MGTERIKVFLSSTFGEFGDARAAIFDAANVAWFGQWLGFWQPEQEGARSGSNEARVEENLGRSHAVLCLVGEEFGSPHPNDESRSIVESELEAAEKLRREARLLDVLVYVKEPLAGEPLPEALDQRQKTFIRKVTHYTSGYGYDTFGSTEELVRKIVDRLGNLVGEYLQEFIRRFESSREHRLARQAAFWTAVVLAALLAAGSGLVLVDSQTALLGLHARLLGNELTALAVALTGTVICGGVALFASRGTRR